MPSYLPSGFSFVQPIKYTAGTLTINFRKQGTGQQFSVIEQTSDWDSQTLLDSFVDGTDPNYQALQKNDLTIYAYGQSSVTWVNGNIWYQITGNSGLSSAQLVDTALSL